MFEKVLKNNSPKTILFFIWSFSVIISALLTIIIIRYTKDENYLLALSISCSVATVASLLTSIPLILIHDKTIKLKDEIIKLSKIDGLTKLTNRTSFMEFFDELMKGVTGNEDNIGVIMFDLDNFKKINDSYGHFAGDAVLVEVGKIVLQLVSQEYLSARFGGEEFIVAVNKIDTGLFAEQIREKLDTHIIYNGEKINFTASVGAVHCTNCNMHGDDLINIADNNLYKAKHSGKNCVSIEYI
jgi:diguanylate cyclase (GGDEF)-like protein